MQVASSYPDGVFSWVDLGTTDPEAAKKFYGGLFGWSFLDVSTDSGTVYSMARLEGYNVAGLGPLDPGMQEQGVPPYWSSYVNHADVDAVAGRVAAAGGNVMVPPFDVMDAGRMAVIQDPTGATLGVWQPVNHIGAQLVNIPNTLTWNELQTPDLEAAQPFYAAVFGWTYEMDENGYVAASAGDRVQAGMMQMTGEMAHIPPNWSVYFLVEDVEAVAAKVSDMGGSLLVPVTSAGQVGRFCVAQDPQGAVFHIIEYAGPASPPPGY